jgi:hypothetical protein
MTLQQPDVIAQAVGYCTHQAEKGLDSLVALMQRTGADWQRCLDGMSEAQADFAPAGEWSAKQVVNHFLEVSRGVNQQIARITRGQTPEGSLDEESLARQGGAHDCETVAEMSTWLAEVYDDTVALTRSLVGNTHLEETFPHPAFGQLNILQWIAFQRLHGMDHMNQIDQNKADAAYPAA